MFSAPVLDAETSSVAELLSPRLCSRFDSSDEHAHASSSLDTVSVPSWLCSRRGFCRVCVLRRLSSCVVGRLSCAPLLVEVVSG